MSEQPQSARKTLLGINLPPVIGIFLTVFLDIFSFGLFLPDLQLRAQSFGADGIKLGFVMASYSVANLLLSPVFGLISDRFGRRRVLMATSMIATIAYVIYANSTSLEWVVVARIFLGGAGASVSTAFAYMADITTPEERGKGMGLLGAAFGLGFILGPVIGALLLSAGHDQPVLLGYSGGAMSLINFLYIWLLLPDSMPKNPSEKPADLFRNFGEAFRSKDLAFLLILFFAINFAFTNLESTFFLLLHDPRAVFGYSAVEAKKVGAEILATIGLVSAIIQGGVIQKIMPVFGEVKLIRFAYIILPLTLASLPFAKFLFPGLVVLLCMAIASGLAQPSLQSLISRSAPATIQGGVFGITQSLGAMARLIGPILSTAAFAKAFYLPYLIGAFVYLFATVGSWFLRQPAAFREEQGLETVVAH